MNWEAYRAPKSAKGMAKRRAYSVPFKVPKMSGVRLNFA